FIFVAFPNSSKQEYHLGQRKMPALSQTGRSILAPTWPKSARRANLAHYYVRSESVCELEVPLLWNVGDSVLIRHLGGQAKRSSTDAPNGDYRRVKLSPWPSLFVRVARQPIQASRPFESLAPSRQVARTYTSSRTRHA